MKLLLFCFAVIFILFASGCETATEKNLVDGTIRRKNYNSDIQRPKDERLPHQRRMDDQTTYPWK